MSPETAAERGNTASAAPFEPVLRPRVIERLRHAAKRRITLVVAPAGFGKSVAIRQYLETDGIEHLRFSVRKEHDSLVGFLRGLVVALEPIAPKASKSVAGAYEKASRGATPVRDLAAWVAGLLAHYEGTVVVDDLHFATGERTAELLAEVIDRSPMTLRWVIAARSEGLLPSASWLAYGHRNDTIDEDILQVTRDEARSAFDKYGICPSETELSQVLTITQAWPVAFGFVLRASLRAADLTNAAHSSRETTYNYLADQVFRSLSIDEREFLMKTCMLPRLDQESLRAIDPAGPNHIETLRRNYTFLVSEGPGAYRYHDLFRDYLEHESKSRGGTAFYKSLVNAAESLVRAGYYDQGLSICLNYGLTSLLDDLLEKHGWSLLEAGCVDRVSLALGLVDKSRFIESPVLLSLRARIDDGTGAYESADFHFERALDLARTGAELAVIAEKWAVSLSNRFLLQEAFRIVGKVDAAQCDVNVSARIVGLTAAIEVRIGNLEAAEIRLKACVEKVPFISDRTTLALILHYAGYVSLWLGRPVEARDYCLRALALCRDIGLHDLGGRASSVLYEVSVSMDDLEELTNSLDEMARFARLSGDTGLRQFSLFSDYDAAVERGDFNRAKLLEVAVRSETPVDEERWAQTVVAAEAMRFACSGDFKQAYELEVRYRLDRCPAAARALRAAEIALYASCNYKSVDVKSEIAKAQSLVPDSSLGLRVSDRMLKAICLTSLALVRTGRLEEAEKMLNSIRRAEPGRRSVDLLVDAVRLVIALEKGAPVTDRINSAIGALACSRLGGYARLLEMISAGRDAHLVSLTQSEIRVVSLLREGHSSKDIARKLGRSRLTIDTHVKTILKKLGCSSRWEAVAKLNRAGFFDGGVTDRSDT
jgi:DNA-binding CsgD family transcriptional regulator/tetratricopeptide (TPR) repeat protein